MKTNSWPCLGVVVNRLLTQVYLLHSQIGQAPAETIRPLKLTRGAVLRLTSKGGLRSVRILQGTAWLTGNPAGRDEVLQTEDQSTLTGQGPFVIEALSNLEIILNCQS